MKIDDLFDKIAPIVTVVVTVIIFIIQRCVI